MKQTDDWVRKQTIRAKDLAVVLYLNGGCRNEEGLTNRECSGILWGDMKKFRMGPVPDWLINRVKLRFKSLRDWSSVEVINAPPYGPSKKYIYRLTKKGEEYAEYHIENNEDELIVDV